MTAPTSPSPDSLAAIACAIRACAGKNLAALADRIERLDAEMRKGITREDTDVVMPFDLYVKMTEADTKLTAENEQLRAKLAACESDAQRYQWLRDHKCNSLHLTRDGDHACNYMSAAEWIDTAAPEWFADDDAEEVQRMRDTNTIWSLQIYPDTPIGFVVANGATLDHVMDALASRAASDPGPIHPWQGVGAVNQEEPPRS